METEERLSQIEQRPRCDYTGALALSLAQLCRCDTCQLYASRLHVDILAIRSAFEANQQTINELREALEECVKAIQQLMPGIRHIAVQDYENINIAPIMARAALANSVTKVQP
jgi:hypothetical protein